jgi:RHS repeat-associated protein
MKITILKALTVVCVLFSGLISLTNNAQAFTSGTGKTVQLSGEFQASGGEAAYSLPISVSPGRAGHQPKLSFEYRSDSPNGDLGMGWSLGGISNITRCGKNLHKDGRWGGVNFDSHDRYCLDGQRLIAVSGKDGEDLTEYRLEKNGYDKIVSFGRTGGSGPAYFKIWRKDGSVYEYGNSGDSRVELPGQAHVYKWSLNKITDGSKNNHISFLYIENNGAGIHRLSQVEYVGGKVKFKYESRSDATYQYFYASTLKRNLRLKNVETYDGNKQLIGSYNLSYHYSSGTKRSLIDQVEYCASGLCSTALKFSWAEKTQVNLDGGREMGFYQPYFIDQNNDGISSIYGKVSPTVSAKYKFKNPIAESPYSPVNPGAITSNVKSFALSGKSTALSLILNQCSADVGASYKTRDGIYHNYCRCSTSSCSYVSKGNNSGDFNGDGGEELTSGYQVADFNGDGLDDKYIFDIPGGSYKYLITGKGEQVLPDHGNKVLRAMADVNNDGYLDVLMQSDSSNRVSLYLFNGISFNAPITLSHTIKPTTSVKFVDINNDGYPELVHQGKFYLNQFGTITQTVLRDLGLESVDSSGDWNGDGWADVVGHASASGKARVYYSQSAIQDKITTFHEYGIQYSVTYKPAVDRSVLTQTYYDANNIRNVTPRRYLVSQVMKAPRGYASTRYAYYYVGAKSHQLGGGFLGFAQITEVENGEVSTKTITDFEQVDLVKVGKPNRIRIYKNNTLISDTAYTYTSNSYQGYKAKYYQAYASTIHQKQYGLSGTVIEKQQVIQHTLNRFGNIVDELISTSSGLEGAGEYTQHNAYKYLSDGMTRQNHVLSSVREITNISSVLARYKSGVSFYCTSSGEMYVKPDNYVILIHDEVDTPLLLESYSDYFKYAMSSANVDSDELARYGGSFSQVSAQEFTQSGATPCPGYLLSDVDGDGLKEITTSYVAQYVTESETNYWKTGAVIEVSSILNDETSGLSRTTRQTLTYTDQGFIASQATQGSDYESGGVSAVGSKSLITAYQYDQWGNVTAETQSGTDLPQRKTTTQYDSQGVFATSSTNALGHVSHLTYNARGLLTRTVSPLKSRATAYQYDSFGRVVSETLPGVNNVNTTAYRLGSDCPQTTNRTATCIETTAATGARVITHYDYADREVRQLHTGFQGKWVTVDTEWDRNGRKVKVSRPHYLAASAPYVTFGYDLLNREVMKSEPADGGRAVYQTAYQGLKTIVTDARGFQHSTQSNVMGYILRKNEPLGAYQTYSYYPDGSLRSSQDSKGNVTQIRYDSLGHRTYLDDPDMGKWSYTYNAAGELVDKKDANGVVTRIVYDNLGRKIKQTENGNVSVWRYDQRGAVGMISGFSGNGNQTEYYYNQSGLVEEIAVRVDGEKFSTHYFYDNYERVSREVRPNGTDTTVWGSVNSISGSSNAQDRLAVEYVYNPYGYVSAVRSPRSFADEVFTSASFRDDIRKLLNEAIAQAGIYLSKAEHYSTQMLFYKEKAAEYGHQTANVYALDSTSASLLKGYRYKQWCNDDGECYLKPAVWTMLHDKVTIPVDVTLDGAIYRLSSTLTASSSKERDYAASVDPVTEEEFNSQSLTADHDLYLADYAKDGQMDLVNNVFVADSSTQKELLFTADDLTDAATVANSQYEFYAQLAEQLIDLSEKVAELSGLYCEYANQLGGNLLDEATRSSCQNTETTSQAEQLNLILTQSELEESSSNQAYIYYWQRRDTDAYDHTLSETLGNGLANTYIHDPNTGRPSMITTHKASALMNSKLAGSLGSGQVIRSLLYRYDKHNNVVYRQDEELGITDTWTYDALDRVTSNTIALESSTRHGADNPDFDGPFTYQYDTLGNITYKKGIGSYEYDGKAAGPHAVTKANGLNYAYDSAGNMLRAWVESSSDNEREISWNAFNKPETITRNGNTVTFLYDANHNRYLKTSSDGKETFYFGKYYERITDSSTGEVQHKHFIYADGKLIALNTQVKDADDKLKDKQVRYLHYDALESVDMITDGYGVIVERRSYDTWGKQRKVSWREDGTLDVVQAVITNRGYTGHEEITEVGLVHMNGRVYDQELGRFVSADPIVQEPFITNSFNRYTYVWNNPVKFTDPRGFFVWAAYSTEMGFMHATMATNGKSPLHGKSKKDGGILGEPSSNDQVGYSEGRVGRFGQEARSVERIGRFGRNTHFNESVEQDVKDDAAESLDAHDEDVEDQRVGSENGPKKVKDIRIRTTKVRGTTRLGKKPGAPGIKVRYEDGTEFDMDETRVKEKEYNPYTGKTRPKKYDNALNKQRDKRAPTPSESSWFNDVVNDSNWQSGDDITLDNSSDVSGPPSDFNDSVSERR